MTPAQARDLPLGAHRLYWVMLYHMTRHRTVPLTREELAAASGLTERSVYKTAERLEQEGLITRTGISGTVYRVRPIVTRHVDESDEAAAEAVLGMMLSDIDRAAAVAKEAAESVAIVITKIEKLRGNDAKS